MLIPIESKGKYKVSVFVSSLSIKGSIKFKTPLRNIPIRHYRYCYISDTITLSHI